ncbi:MAG: glycosyltransferase [Prevotella sp.]|jgi:glycosyltransferase involved in cell wall biosynthesis|nr:glycosyltransferase [Prevotella sp.]
MYKYKVSYIVPIYNVEQYLGQCIESLLHQDLDHSEYEIILINDGSTDSSGEIATTYSKEYDNISLYYQENAGLSVARNTGMNHVQGKYTIFVDSDDAWFPNKLRSLIDLTEKNNLDICFFGFIRNTPSGPEKGYRQPFKNNQIYTGEEILLHRLRVASIWDKVYSTDFISKYRYYPGISHQDVEFNFRTLPFAKRIMFVDTVAYNYTWNENSISRSKEKLKVIKRIKDDVIIVRNIKEFVSTAELSTQLKSYYEKRANSIMLSVLHLPFKKDVNLDRKTINNLLNYAKSIKVYPVKGRTESRKSTRLLKIFNIEILYRCLLYFYCKKNG